MKLTDWQDSALLERAQVIVAASIRNGASPENARRAGELFLAQQLREREKESRIADYMRRHRCTRERAVVALFKK